jgi:hypothetical protein
MGMVFLTRQEYTTRIHKEITKLNNSFKVTPLDVNNYQPLINKSLTKRDSIIKLIKASIRKIENKKALFNFLSDNEYQDFPIIRSLPKLHKEGERMRLLLPYNKNIFRTIHTFIAKTLQPIALRLEPSLTSVYELIKTLTQSLFLTPIHNHNSNTIHHGCLLPQDLIITADLENMYNNINLQLAIDMILNEIEEYKDEFFMFGRTKNENTKIWKEIIHMSFEDAIFQFEGKLIQQTYGVPMGSPAGPLLAVILINTIIKKKLHDTSFDSTPLILVRMYIDDGVFIIRGKTKQDVIPLITSLISWPGNTVKWEEESIKIYTAEELCSQQTSFLDTSISCTPTTINNQTVYRITTSVYTKPMGTYQYLHWKSAHPRSMKRSVIKGEINRRYGFHQPKRTSP